MVIDETNEKLVARRDQRIKDYRAARTEAQKARAKANENSRGSALGILDANVSDQAAIREATRLRIKRLNDAAESGSTRRTN